MDAKRLTLTGRKPMEPELRYSRGTATKDEARYLLVLASSAPTPAPALAPAAAWNISGRQPSDAGTVQWF